MDQLEQLEACRICVTCFPLQEMDFIHLFQPNEEFQQELNFIQNEITHWQLKIQPEDGLPQRICANCFAKFCSIQAFRKECQKAQEDLIETVLMQQSEGNTSSTNVESQNGQIKNSDNPLPLMGNFEPTSVVLNADNNVLVSSVNLTQSDVSLNDFPVFDHQQFAHFDNPSLMDEASTLLDGSNLIAGETTQELGFLPSQNLFTFETAEPPSTGTLPLVETDTTSIINDMLDQKTNVQENEQNIIIKHEDLDEMLKHSIIPTTSTKKSTQTQQQQNEQIIMENNNNLEIKMQPETNSKKGEGNHYNSNYIKVRNDSPNAIITFVNRDDSNSDLECDETDVNTRLKGQSYACHYCFCPETGPIEHLVFPNEDALSQHFFDVHDPNRPYTCPKCPQSYKTQLLRDNHVRLLHKIVELQTCNYCQKRLKGSIEVHQYNCQYVGDWECEQCKEKFEQTPLYRFRLHQRQHERITTKQFKCRLCERNFAKKANLEAHQRIHKVEAQTNASHCCNVCKATFVDDYELKRHKYQQHNAEHPLKCKICLRGFSSKVFLQRHINQFHPDHNPNHSNASSATSTTTTTTTPTSSGATSPTYQHVCLNCNVGFKTLKKLQTHLLMGRDTNGNCLYSTSNKLERRKLQLQGVFPCFHCPRRFHLRSQLDKHLNTHDARLRPYQCEQCVTRCRTAFELKQHVNVAHLNIKAFSCDKCGKCFGYKKYLRDHMLFHAEINVKCTEEGCDYVCKNEKALNDHIRHKHRLLSCEYCHEQFTRQKLTAHLRKIHRSEIDVELACESDNYYKSQLLNNNNDITQISFNLLNTQQQQTQQQLQLNKTTTTTSLTSPSITSSTSLVETSLTESQIQTTSALTITTNSSSSSSPPPPPSSSLLTTIIATSTAPTLSSSPSSSCLTSSSSGNLSGTNLSSCSLVESHNHLINDVEHHDQQQQTQSQQQQQNHPDQLHNLFANDAPDGSNGTSTLALNGLVSSTDHVDDANDHLNLVSNDASNIFLVSSNTSSTANDNQLDQYFMASLIDTEQEIIVT